MSRIRRDDRALSTSVGYVIGLGVTMLLITTLLFAAGNFVGDQREQAVRTELGVLGQQMSNDISRVDRAVEATGSSNVDRYGISQSLPDDVAGSGYYVDVVTSGSNPYLRLRSQRPEITVRVNITTETSMADTTVAGGDYRVEYDPSSDEVVVTDD